MSSKTTFSVKNGERICFGSENEKNTNSKPAMFDFSAKNGGVTKNIRVVSNSPNVSFNFSASGEGSRVENIDVKCLTNKANSKVDIFVEKLPEENK